MSDIEDGRFIPIKVIGEEAEKLGYPLDPKSLLCGLVIGMNREVFDDEEKFRLQVRAVLANPMPPTIPIVIAKEGSE